ncbi:sensor histidine kinase [Methanothermobacter sp. THM-2]|uniref:sensor histidine kinase n=1 Tax=Methanothermobacter sp. THM-2 TaxID=2606912 RepID=UPI001365B316|nr:histidine kinase dimerization/phosphoacceptor domain -containing protein [Methanothermobacter sp. THM-2]QHN08589.1 sensor histidine kinase [Methanothermobacter sp. THM-2]
MNNNGPEGVFLILRKDGFIEKIIDHGSNIPLTIESFVDLMDMGSQAKASLFIQEINDKGAAYNWELNLKNLKTYHFSGFMADERIYAVGAARKEDMIKIYRLVDTELPETPEMGPSAGGDVKEELFDELTRLNNQLSAARRELLKKNMELEKALKEKEMLLREINHRVKNNLMIISSILNIQSRYVKDRDDLMLFREAQSKARAMAMLHERLYTSGKHRRVDFGEYLRGLVRDLYQTFLSDPGRIALETDIDEAELDINTVVPLALIVNELFTNAIKHAFPEGKKGKIRVSFKKEDGSYILAVEDDGVGLPENFDLQSTSSMGMQLVRSLTDQLNGNLKVESEGGTRFSIEFRDWK